MPSPILTYSGLVTAKLFLDPLAGIPFTFRLQTHRGDNVPLGLYRDLACTAPAALHGDPIAVWRDELTASGIKAIQEDPALQPRLGYFNGVPTVVFSANNTHLTLGDLSALIPVEATLTAAFTPVYGSSTDTFYTVYDTAQNDSWWQYNGVGFFGTLRTARLNSYPASGMPFAGNHTVSILSGEDFEVRLDGESQGVETGDYAPGTVHTIGSAVDRSMNGYVTAVALRPSVNQARLAEIEEYFASLQP